MQLPVSIKSQKFLKPDIAIPNEGQQITQLLDYERHEPFLGNIKTVLFKLSHYLFRGVISVCIPVMMGQEKGWRLSKYSIKIVFISINDGLASKYF